jgi:hypothetical protein
MERFIRDAVNGPPRQFVHNVKNAEGDSRGPVRLLYLSAWNPNLYLKVDEQNKKL